MLAHVLNNMDASRTALLNGRGRIGRWRGRSAFDQPRAHTGAASGHEHRHAAFRSVAPGPVSLHGRARGVQSIRCPACQRQSADERPSRILDQSDPFSCVSARRQRSVNDARTALWRWCAWKSGRSNSVALEALVAVAFLLPL